MCNGKVTVRYCTEHTGHIVTASSLRLSDADRQAIGHYLQLGLNVPTILRVIRKQYNNPNHRVYWANATDIRNAQHSLAMEPGRLHKDNLQCILIRFRMQLETDGIRRFDLPISEDGTGFRLVIITAEQVEFLKRYSDRGIAIDNTHCTTRYSLKFYAS
ncbi:hypothetical protein Y032_0048g1636 [Ancylostoma ceylanicum]|uniref:Uncharacterized protein n=1 Tax=Ancylostoma ceylanicum TaxID=53326 RepID=A0A016UB34_9BILA|nr:hypothetical protein Y032_0048g1636 [Ancylostoma ceylanicum]